MSSYQVRQRPSEGAIPRCPVTFRLHAPETGEVNDFNCPIVAIVIEKWTGVQTAISGPENKQTWAKRLPLSAFQTKTL